MSWLKQHRILLLVSAIFLLALFLRVRVAQAGLSGAQGFVMGDDDDYYRVAISLLTTGRLADGAFVAYRMPFFPTLLAANYFLFGTAPQTALPFLILLSAFTCVLTFFLGRQLFDSHVGVLAALLCALDLGLIFYSQFLLTETLIVFLVLASLIALESLRQTSRWQWAVIAGALLACATLTRVNIALFVAFALAWLIYNARGQRWRMARLVAIIALLVSAAWLAWIERNFSELNAFVPLTTQGGNGYYGIYNDAAASEANPLNFGYWIWLKVELPDGYDHGASKEVQLDRYQRELAFDWIRQHPTQALAVALSQVVHLWQPETFADLIYVPFLIFAALIGFGRAVAQKREGILLWALLGFVFTATALLSIAVPRFRLPLHPGLAVFAAFAIVTSWQRVRAQKHLAALADKRQSLISFDSESN